MRERRPRAALGIAASAFLAACTVIAPTPSPTATPSPTQRATPTASATPTSSPSAAPEPPNGLDLPAASDPRRVRVEVATELDGETGRILVTVTNLSDTRIGQAVREPAGFGKELGPRVCAVGNRSRHWVTSFLQWTAAVVAWTCIRSPPAPFRQGAGCARR